MDANKENPLNDLSKKYHFYTRPADTPDSGSDSVYKQDGDNVIVGWMKAGATSGDTAEFGVYRDSKPGEGKRNAPTIFHQSSLTSALLKKGARPWTSNLDIQGTAYNAIKWDNGTDNTNATLNFSDGSDTITIAHGTAASLGTGTHYLYLNGVSGTLTPTTTTTHATAIGDSKILLALITVGTSTQGTSPTILPLNSKLLINLLENWIESIFLNKDKSQLKIIFVYVGDKNKMNLIFI